VGKEITEPRGYIVPVAGKVIASLLEGQVAKLTEAIALGGSLESLVGAVKDRERPVGAGHGIGTSKGGLGTTKHALTLTSLAIFGTRFALVHAPPVPSIWRHSFAKRGQA
jgi:hypothetical protein